MFIRDRVNTDYTARGLVNRVFASGTDYVQDTTYDEAGRVIQRRLGSLPILETSFWYYGWADVNGRGRVGSIDTTDVSIMHLK